MQLKILRSARRLKAPGRFKTGCAQVQPGCNLFLKAGVQVLFFWACLKGAPSIEIAPSLDFSYFSGYTRYVIRGNNAEGSWRSELTFPINNVRVEGAASLKVSSLPAEFCVSGWATLDTRAGTLRDDDYQNGVRDVWSRSNAELEAWGLEGKVRSCIAGKGSFRFGPVISVQYDRLDYSVYNVRQFGLQPQDFAEVDGKVLSYRQERISFPAGLCFCWKATEELRIEGEAQVSAFTFIWDRDDHILRSKLSETEGFAVVVPACLKIDWSPLRRVHLGAFGRFFYLRTWWAYQDQSFYGGPRRGEAFEDVHATIERMTFSVGAFLKFDL